MASIVSALPSFSVGFLGRSGSFFFFFFFLYFPSLEFLGYLRYLSCVYFISVISVIEVRFSLYYSNSLDDFLSIILTVSIFCVQLFYKKSSYKNEDLFCSLWASIVVFIMVRCLARSMAQSKEVVLSLLGDIFIVFFFMINWSSCKFTTPKLQVTEALSRLSWLPVILLISKLPSLVVLVHVLNKSKSF